MSIESPKKKKTLKEIEMPKEINCGLQALSKLGDLKNVSAFTLIHLARDNGQTIQVFKVLDNKDLVRVIRPAIFHQKDHFVYVDKDEPMPQGEYTGFVLGPVILGRVVSLAEAKFITGGKNFFTGQNKDGEQTGHGALIDIIAAVGSIITANPLTGAAIEAGGSAIERAQNPAQLGSPYNPLSIATDAVKGFAIGSGAAGGAQGVAAGGSSQTLPAAVTNFGKGAFQGVTQSFSHPIATSANGLTIDAGSNLGAQSVASGINPGLLSQSANSGISGVPAGYGTLSNGAGAATGATNIGGYTGAGATFNPNFNLSEFSNLPSNFQGAVPTSGASGTATGLLDKVGGAIGNSFNSNPIGTITTGIGALGVFGSQPPAYSGASPIQNYTTTSQFLGPNALTQPTNDQLSTYISTPIEDLAKTFTNNSTRVQDAINQSYDNQKQSLVHQFAQAGQNTSNSSELQDKVSQLEQKRSTDLSNAALEVQNAGVSQAIQVKQQALSQGMQAGQFNQTLAMQLAGLTGDQQNLQYAIANNDYQSFQQIMGKLLTIGIPQNVNVSNGSGLLK